MMACSVRKTRRIGRRRYVGWRTGSIKRDEKIGHGVDAKMPAIALDRVLDGAVEHQPFRQAPHLDQPVDNFPAAVEREPVGALFVAARPRNKRAAPTPVQPDLFPAVVASRAASVLKSRNG